MARCPLTSTWHVDRYIYWLYNLEFSCCKCSINTYRFELTPAVTLQQRRFNTYTCSVNTYSSVFNPCGVGLIPTVMNYYLVHWITCSNFCISPIHINPFTSLNAHLTQIWSEITRSHQSEVLIHMVMNLAVLINIHVLYKVWRFTSNILSD